MIQFDEHVFQMGWFNHRIEKFWLPNLRRQHSQQPLHPRGRDGRPGHREIDLWFQEGHSSEQQMKFKESTVDYINKDI